MAKHRRIPRGKTINPTFFVFCEGESEDAYVSFLKSKYRLPIQIITKVLRNSITKTKVNKELNSHTRHAKDKVYLLYDIDTTGMLEKLKVIKDTTLLVSNPCFELWYILHYCNHTAEISTADCIRKIESFCKSYKKGSICDKLRGTLSNHSEKATARARKLAYPQNPSTSVYLLIDDLTELKRTLK